ncbi:MAG: NifB/NifX family molybdenum-iron cluster-binding protein [Desulfobulbaceae bacterium]|nr:NifB/NifX family molybdenum-iron cluster-binding protein [Desulfobulbaceae bacterium]MDY0349624.1 NifB/NifX family molybdenum-iron cluster-binding protein [Desulfobulbaceae bacterium]
MQKIAVTVWGHRVSPVFDSARTLLIAELVDGRLGRMSTLELDPENPFQLMQLLRAQNIAVLICGAVSQDSAIMLENAEFEVIPFIAGNVQEVLETLSQDNPEWTEFIMPGCDRRICCRGKIRRGSELLSHLPDDSSNGDPNR